MTETLRLSVEGQGLHEITGVIRNWLARQTVSSGLLTLFLRHTSASLLIQENADPSVRRDLECWFNRLVPEGDDLYTHTLEGPDDMPAHIKASLLATSLAVPVLKKELMLGTWQGIFLWEHRYFRGHREVVLHLQADET